MEYNQHTLIPIIPANEYDSVATSFLEKYFTDALQKPMPVPILDIAREKMGLDVKFLPITEEHDIYGMTVFEDGIVELYDSEEELYNNVLLKRKTVLIDPVAVQKTNVGCRNNTISHECVHWFKHRMYYRMQQFTLPRHAKYCKCPISKLSSMTEDEDLLEAQAVGIAPRILMPRNTFTLAAEKLSIQPGRDNWREINELAGLFEVSKQSVSIRLEECGIV